MNVIKVNKVVDKKNASQYLITKSFFSKIKITVFISYSVEN